MSAFSLERAVAVLGQADEAHAFVSLLSILFCHPLIGTLETILLAVVYVFPGLGLGATLAGCNTITDRMLYVCAVALAEFVSPEELQRGQVFPPLSKIREVSHRLAVTLAQEAIRDGQATKISKVDAEKLDEFVAQKMYYPEYVPLVEKRTLVI
jgi:malate dehydrogenase (oxaloacetate-decarboxylating)(NADP+)